MADGGELVDAVLVFDRGRAFHAVGSALDGEVERGAHVVHLNGDVLHAVAVEHEALHVVMARPQRRRDDERDAALFEHVPRFLLLLRFEPGVGHDIEAERVPVEKRALPCVPHEESHVIDLAKRDVLHDGPSGEAILSRRLDSRCGFG